MLTLNPTPCRATAKSKAGKLQSKFLCAGVIFLCVLRPIHLFFIKKKRCPEYPQDLIIRLLCGPARISKVQVLSHHYKIATKIDVYIGILKDPATIQDEFDEHVAPSEDDDDDMVIEFTRLG